MIGMAVVIGLVLFAMGFSLGIDIAEARRRKKIDDELDKFINEWDEY